MRLIIASNRVTTGDKPHAGGLACAIQNALSKVDGLWMGWNGEVKENEEIHQSRQNGIEYHLFPLKEKEYLDYYLGFSNEVLWPICHLRPSYLRAIENHYKTYRDVNQKFAQQILKCHQEGDVVWVHDYHLLLVASYLRELGLKGKTGYFHHIPVPPPELIRTIPHHDHIFTSLLSYNVVGVQTQGDLKNLFDYYQQLSDNNSYITIQGSAQNSFSICFFDRTTRFGVYPISIDTLGIEQLSEKSQNYPEILELQESLQQRPLLIGVDRIDYSKGLENKYHALDKYLNRYPSDQAPVLLQIANQSKHDLTTYQALRTQLEALASKINADHGTPSYSPIRYLNTVYPHEVLTGLYRAARVGLVTPTKDGMNLVAKEFVAAQNPKDPGVLVLSEFAGAANELTEALIVNPFHTHNVTQAIHEALNMPRSERIQRHQALLHKLRKQDIHAWCRSFMQDLGVASEADAVEEVQP